jgi:hypothetical protein
MHAGLTYSWLSESIQSLGGEGEGDTHTGPAFKVLPIGSLPGASGHKMRFTGTIIFRVLTALQQLQLVPTA